MAEAKYKPICVIGKGTFGTVSKVLRRSDGQIVAWKELHYGNMTEREKQQLVKEVNILRELEHPNIVKYLDRVIDRTQKKIYVVMEYCGGGDLAELIKMKKRERRRLEEGIIWKVLRQVAEAISHCHNSPTGKILHRDLKPGNVFLDARRQVKLGDFGLARILRSSIEYARTHVGTPYYMSPEQVSEKSYNEKSDIWSLGCLTYELINLNPPFRATNQLALAKKIHQGRYDPIPRHYSQELRSVVRSMLMVDPSRRPTITQVVQIATAAEQREREKKRRDSGEHRARRRSSEAMGAASTLLKREEELRKRELAVEQREQAVKQKEQQLKRRSQQLDIQKTVLDNKESRLMDKAIELYKLESVIFGKRAGGYGQKLWEKENLGGDLGRKNRPSVVAPKVSR